MVLHVRRIVLTVGLCVTTATSAGAKPPDLPTTPETEFKVPSPFAQEYFQADDKNAPDLFVPVTDWSPLASAASKVRDVIVETLTNQWAKLVYEMAEAHRRAGDLTEAKRWYAGVREMYPQSIFAQLAKQQLERLELLRIAAEAGEEQSEEPPVARLRKFEHLTVMPRLVPQKATAVERLSVAPRVVKP
jgi:hypothetical protein